MLSLLVVQVSHPYVTTGKSIAFTLWTFVSEVMSLLLNKLSRFVTVLLQRKTFNFMTAIYHLQ